mmetsp:Transcript_36892/g.86604  ORF Transcript_36892/g.86604 Transcript_36892/m.86604 type:complete len:310 (-) Transcript_36892:685-1614(-)
MPGALLRHPARHGSGAHRQLSLVHPASHLHHATDGLHLAARPRRSDHRRLPVHDPKQQLHARQVRPKASPLWTAGWWFRAVRECISDPSGRVRLDAAELGLHLCLLPCRALRSRPPVAGAHPWRTALRVEAGRCARRGCQMDESPTHLSGAGVELPPQQGFAYALPTRNTSSSGWSPCAPLTLQLPSVPSLLGALGPATPRIPHLPHGMPRESCAVLVGPSVHLLLCLLAAAHLLDLPPEIHRCHLIRSAPQWTWTSVLAQLHLHGNLCSVSLGPPQNLPVPGTLGHSRPEGWSPQLRRLGRTASRLLL